MSSSPKVATASSEAASTATAPAAAAVKKPSAWQEYAKGIVAFCALVAGYVWSFSYDMNDSYDTFRWMWNGENWRLAEFRHVIQRMLPLYLWLELRFDGIHISPMRLLTGIDFVCAALAVMLLYRTIREWTGSNWLAFWTAFGFGTCHCIWVYAGSGRLYSTSMFLVTAGYYLAWHVVSGEHKRSPYWVAFGAGAMMSLASLFWLVHVFNALAGGFLILLYPRESFRKRLKYFLFYGTVGTLIAAGAFAATMKYADIPFTQAGVQKWVAATETQPMKLYWQSPMNASFGQASGIVVMYQLPYMINGLIRPFPKTVHMASLPWQATKFVFVWILLLLAYVYPLVVWKRSKSPAMRALIAALYFALAVNLWFGLAWLGSDMQRFMPTLISQFALAAISVQHLLSRTAHRRVVAGVLIASLLFIAADNLAESLLPSQTRYHVLAAEQSDLHPYIRPNDLLLTFGRDYSISFAAMSIYYTGLRTLNLSNDIVRWRWDAPDWQQQLTSRINDRAPFGGRTFVSERLYLGLNPAVAGWNERQRSYPTLRQVSDYFQHNYCGAPAFVLEGIRYWELSPKSPVCPRYKPQLWPLAKDGKPRCCAPVMVNTDGFESIPQ